MSPRVERSDRCRSWTVVEHVESRWFAGGGGGGGGANELTLPTRREKERININGEAEIIPLLWFIILVLTDATMSSCHCHGRDRKMTDDPDHSQKLRETTPKNCGRRRSSLGKDIDIAVCDGKAAPAPPQSYQFSSATAIILLEACRRQKSPWWLLLPH